MKSYLSAVIALMLALTVVPSRAADTVPAELSDAAFWKMISDFSEPGGSFQLEIITSNEQTYISNVEDYIQSVWASYSGNIASLPLDNSSTFIHWSPGSSTTLQAMSTFVRGR